MKDQNKVVWSGIEDLTQDPSYKEIMDSEFNGSPEISEIADLTAGRRDFLKYLGFGIGAATVAAGCEIPVRKAIPYVVKPDSIVPGVATYYASSFVQGGDYCSILVKTREGRPIKIEGNNLSKVTMGGTSARVQASVLSLYDNNRFDGPYRVTDAKVNRTQRGQMGVSWVEIDEEILKALKPESRIAIISPTIISPTTHKAISEFQAKYTNTRVVMYDAVSSAAIIEANELSFAQAVIPSYHFDKAAVIVSFDADFLGTWISPIEFAAQYVQHRRVNEGSKSNMSHHVQVESHMTLTGSNADNRILVKPSEQGAAIVALYNEIAKASGAGTVGGAQASGELAGKMAKIASELLGAKGHSLVVSGSNNVGEQVLVNAINNMLGNYGATIDFTHASLQRRGLDKNVQQLIKDMAAGQIDALLVMDGANPAYDLPNSDAFQEAMAKVGMKISFSGTPNETALLCNYITPTHHYLESWGDAQPKKGHYSLIQPVIYPLFRTRQAEESLLRWAASDNLEANADQPYMEYLKSNWEETLYPLQTRFVSFQTFWDSSLHDGVLEVEQQPVTVAFAADPASAAAKVRKPGTSELEISFFETVNMGGGQYANNPWLQELPDPVTRTVWGNYLAIPVIYDGGKQIGAWKNLNPKEIYGKADKVEVEVNAAKQTVTCVRQFGQMRHTVALALGYGRKETGFNGKAIGNAVGINVYPWLWIDEDGNTQYYNASVNVSDKVGEEDEFACVQHHHSMGVTAKDANGKVVLDKNSNKPVNIDEKTLSTVTDPFNENGFQGGLTERSIIYQSSLKEVDELIHKIKEKREEAEKLNIETLYPYEEYTEKFYSQGHHWGMHIDLNACIGCGTCQVACMAENNIPVVGKREVHRHHEMSWLRIDRYFYGDYENPNVVYQPMMCQHCDNAPCENVCPVAATNHSSEGLNQMTYNRCIGTRYCANNCPYKVRRFNWLDYTTADLFGSNEYAVNGEDLRFGADNLTRMVLNPDVTVRSRGVIEKCSFCVQRLQEGKLTAKREGRSLKDSDVRTACQTACPTGAIVFGDQNNKQGDLAQKMDNHPLNYQVLEEINTRPSVNYSARVNNRLEEV